MDERGCAFDSPARGPRARHQVGGADDQLHRLGDGHEVARHLLVGDRDRAAGRDLPAEDRHDRAGGAEHVAEPHRRVARVAVAVLRGLDGPLGQRLGRAHHGRGRHRLVGGHQHEPLDAGLARGRGHDPGGHRVVAHGLDRVLLHQRDVLVGGGVEDHRRLLVGEQLLHPRGVLAVGQHRGQRAEVVLVLEVAADLEQVVLGVVDQDQPARLDAGDLAAQLGADRAAGAGDDHHAVAQVGADRSRSRPAPARGPARPRPAPRAPGAAGWSRARAARTPWAACARGCRARGRR